MAIRSSCCINLSPPTPTPLPPKASQLACKKKEERSWRLPCVVGMACFIIGSEMGNLAIGEENGHYAMARDSPEVAKWSDRRVCPPWRANSLESIVPENLPRPSARRRWEAVGYNRNAPPIKLIIGGPNCFSM